MKIDLTVRQNLFTYGVLLLFAAIGIYYGNSLVGSFAFIRVWDFTNLAIMLIGIPFLFVQARAGIPGFWDPAINNKKRLLYPFLAGMAFGILDILVIKGILHPEPYTELPPFLQPFPYSVFLYGSGAFEIEVFYRLIPLTILLLAGKYLGKGKYFNYFLWAGLVLTSLREPIEQLPDGSTWFILYSVLTGFMMNFIQARAFVKYGFIASLVVRLGHYLFWHILLGVYVQFIELA